MNIDGNQARSAGSDQLASSAAATNEITNAIQAKRKCKLSKSRREIRNSNSVRQGLYTGYARMTSQVAEQALRLLRILAACSNDTEAIARRNDTFL